MQKLERIIQRKKLRFAKLEKGLTQIIEQLKEKEALKIILFGSFAKGKVAPDSDLDLMVIMPATKSGKEWIKEIYQDIKRTVACDFLIYNLAEFEEMKNETSILREALRNGRIVYEKRI